MDILPPRLIIRPSPLWRPQRFQHYPSLPALFNYRIDANLILAASALAIPTVVCSAFGAEFPSFAKDMYDRLDPRVASSIFGAITILSEFIRALLGGSDINFVGRIVVPIPFVLNGMEKLSDASPNTCGASRMTRDEQMNIWYEPELPEIGSRARLKGLYSVRAMRTLGLTDFKRIRGIIN